MAVPPACPRVLVELSGVALLAGPAFKPCGAFFVLFNQSRALGKISINYFINSYCGILGIEHPPDLKWFGFHLFAENTGSSLRPAQGKQVFDPHLGVDISVKPIGGGPDLEKDPMVEG